MPRIPKAKLMLAFIFLSSCIKLNDSGNSSTLSPAIYDINNYMRFSINGSERTYSGTGNAIHSAGVAYFPYVDYIVLYGIGGKTDDEAVMHIYQNWSSIKTDSVYCFCNQANSHEARYEFRGHGPANRYYSTHSTGRGWIKFSEISQTVAAGTFAFTAYYDSDSAAVTDGIFRISR